MDLRRNALSTHFLSDNSVSAQHFGLTKDMTLAKMQPKI